MMEGPTSSYSFLEIHNWLNVPSDAKIEPPNQLLLLRSIWLPKACTLTLFPGAIMGNSLLNLSVNPGKSVFPPVTMTLLNSKGRKSISQALMLLNTSFDTPTVCCNWFLVSPNEGMGCASFPGSRDGYKEEMNAQSIASTSNTYQTNIARIKHDFRNSITLSTKWIVVAVRKLKWFLRSLIHHVFVVWNFWYLRHRFLIFMNNSL